MNAVYAGATRCAGRSPPAGCASAAAGTIHVWAPIPGALKLAPLRACAGRDVICRQRPTVQRRGVVSDRAHRAGRAPGRAVESGRSLDSAVNGSQPQRAPAPRPPLETAGLRNGSATRPASAPCPRRCPRPTSTWARLKSCAWRIGSGGGADPAPGAAPPEHTWPGKVAEASRSAAVRREPDRLRRRAERPAGAQPEQGSACRWWTAAVILDMPPTRPARGQAQVELAQAGYNLARMRACGATSSASAADRTRGPGETDRDRPAPGSRPHRGAAQAPGPRAARRCAPSASAPRCRRSRWLHQRRQVSAAQRSQARR